MAVYNPQVLKARVNTYIKQNAKQEITGPVLQSVLQDIIDSLGAIIETSGKIVQYSQNLNAGATRVNVGLTNDKIIVVGRYTLESFADGEDNVYQSGRITLSITDGVVYIIMSDTMDNNNGEGIGVDISTEIDSTDTSKVNLVLTNTTGKIVVFTYSLFQSDASLQGTGVSSINGQTGDVTLNETPVDLYAFPANGAISLGRSDGIGYNAKTIDAPLTITVATGAIEGGASYGVLIADGTNAPNIAAFEQWDDVDFDNTASVANHWWSLRKNGTNYIKWHQVP